MTPKEQAKKLVKEMKLEMRGPGIEANEGNAKRCAFVAAEYVLRAMPMYAGTLNPNWQYWQDVKTEIEKL